MTLICRTVRKLQDSRPRLSSARGSRAIALASRTGGERASAGLKATIADLAERSLKLLDDGAALADLVADTRLACEIAAIRRLAVALASGLRHRDPLSEKVHHSKAGFAVIALASAAGVLVRRPFRRRAFVGLPVGTRGR